ncbi:MAG TPA: kelch repeat-containing protein, partial [Williamwhitmania sp.]|nr:kelch repeat-containing protein [Williamwhitmania sp.]
GGYDGNYLKDLWQYDPSTNTWAQKTSLPGSKRMNAVAFVINDIAYVCTGTQNATHPADFWAYDASTDTWTKKRDIANDSNESYDDNYTSIVRANAVAFVINGLGYITTGDDNTIISTVWEYNPVTDLWTRKTDFEGAARSNAVGFTVSGRGFVVTGVSGSTYLDDIWEFLPYDTYNANDK